MLFTTPRALTQQQRALGNCSSASEEISSEPTSAAPCAILPLVRARAGRDDLRAREFGDVLLIFSQYARAFDLSASLSLSLSLSVSCDFTRAVY